MVPKRLSLGLVLTGLLTGPCLAQAEPPRPQPEPASKQTVAGWIETVAFPEHGITLDAKLDTGAVSSSLSVDDLQRFKRKGKTWYRFTIKGDNGKTATIEQQTNRIARIMRAEVEDVRRPIVRLKICLAGHVEETDFTLTDRSGQQAPVLIGRKFLASRILVDSGRQHLFPKTCQSER